MQHYRHNRIMLIRTHHPRTPRIRLGENPRFRVSIRIGTSIGLDRSGSILDRSRPKILSEPRLLTYLLSFYYNYNL